MLGHDSESFNVPAVHTELDLLDYYHELAALDLVPLGKQDWQDNTQDTFTHDNQRNVHAYISSTKARIAIFFLSIAKYLI